jgi:hypothetical protein
MMDWIKVDKELPEPEEIVIVKSAEGIFTASYCVRYIDPYWRGVCCCIHEVENPYNVTHWMKIPELPKKD